MEARKNSREAGFLAACGLAGEDGFIPHGTMFQLRTMEPNEEIMAMTAQ